MGRKAYLFAASERGGGHDVLTGGGLQAESDRTLCLSEGYPGPHSQPPGRSAGRVAALQLVASLHMSAEELEALVSNLPRAESLNLYRLEYAIRSSVLRAAACPCHSRSAAPWHDGALSMPEIDRKSSILWRRGSESNRRTRLCRPLHNHSATPPFTWGAHGHYRNAIGAQPGTAANTTSN